MTLDEPDSGARKDEPMSDCLSVRQGRLHVEECDANELVERYMKRALAYGMFPGFFSHNASEGHYFTRPSLYNRDRALLKKLGLNAREMGKE